MAYMSDFVRKNTKEYTSDFTLSVTNPEYYKKKKMKQQIKDNWEELKSVTGIGKQKEIDENERLGWAEGWVDTGAFKDGFDWSDIPVSIGATAGNIGVNLLKGSAQAGEGIGKIVAGGVAQVADWTGHDDYADKVRKRLAGKDEEFNQFKDKYYLSSNFNKVSDKLDDASFTGEKLDNLTGSVGQLLGASALGPVGANAIMFGSSAGNELENAYMNGATDGEAWGSAIISGASEIIFEKLSGGIKFGGKTLDEGVKRKLSDAIANKTASTLTKFGLDIAGEGAEEVLTEFTSNIGRKLTYEDEKTWGEVLASDEAIDNYVEAFIGGMLMGGGFNAKRTYDSVKTGRDYNTGLTANEQAVVDKEIENKKAEAEKQGKKLTNKDITKLETEVREALEKGYISTDTIESTLNSDTYNKLKTQKDEVKSIEKQIKELQGKKMSELSVGEYNDATAKIRELQEKLKGIDTNTLETQLNDEMGQKISSDDLLKRSYHEKAQRGVKFEADLTKYDAKQQEVIKRAADSGILNNTRKTHEFVDMLAKISADKGIPFDFANNQKLKESSFAIEGKTINAFVNESGITVNIDSNSALNSVVGHEITHVLEGTELYSELQKAVKEYATTKGVYDSKLKEITELYKDVKNANVENELTADLVGEYLFSDTDFVNNLSAKSPNLFQKIFNEIKYLLKVATAGSKEARQLEKVKKTFEDAYKQKASKTNTDTEYSISGIKAINSMPDSKFKRDALKDYNKAIQMKKEGYDNEIIRQETKWFQDKKGAWKWEFTDASLSLKQKLKANSTYKLEDIIKHDYLFKLYPELKSYDVELQDMKNAGSFNKLDHVIKINNKLLNNEKLMKGTFLHEIQHAIQQLEGFTQGTTTLFGRRRYANNLGEIEAADTKERYLNDTDIKQVAPESSKEKPVHPRREQILSKRGTLEKKLDELYDFVRGVSSEISENDNNLLEENTKFPTGVERSNGSNVRRRGNEDVRQEELDNSSFFVADNQGRQLTKEQQEYFKDSKVKDENGNLLTVYHGTRADFNVFDKNKAGNNYENGWSQSGKGFYFTDNKAEAQEFGDYSLGDADTQIKEVYLNITNPFDTSLEDTQVLTEIGKEYGVDPQFLQRGDFLLRWFRNNNIDASEVLKKHGYDGIIDYGHYVAFDSNQIKNADNTKPTSSADIRYSLSEDTKGRKLSEGQQEYFKDSKVRDENGNLLTMYHGSPNEFSIFDRNYSNANNVYGDGLYFTNIEELAANHSKDNKLYEVYLNVVNPLQEGQKQITKEQIRKFVEATKFNKQSLDFIVGKDATTEEIVSYLYDGSDDFSVLELIDGFSQKNNLTKTIESFNELTGTNYDGIITNRETVVFNSNQIKNVDNLNPTASEDIRYSLSNSNSNIKEVSTGYSNDEYFYEMQYIEDDKIAGTLKYGEYNGEPNVKMIEVKPEFQRKGIGTKLLQELQKKYDGIEIDFGMSTPDGTKLLEKATYTVEDAEVVKKQNRIDEIQRILDEYDKGYENYFDNDLPVPQNYAEDYNDLYDEQRRLQDEIRWKSATKRFVRMDDNYSLSNPNDIAPIKDKNLTYGEDVKIDLPIKDELKNLSNQVSELNHKLNKIAFGEATTQEEMENLSNVVPNDIAPIRNNLTAEESQELDILEALPFDLTDNLQERADELSNKEIGEPVIQTEGIDRDTPAFMKIEKNAELKPYFKAEAEIMLAELKDTIKGQRMIIGDTSQFGSANDQQYIGIKRQTSEDIARLLDGYGYSYSRIEAGLNRIIEDKSYSEASRTILNVLEDRLIDGYKTIEGYEIPANNEFISQLKDTQMSSYNDEAYQEWANTFGDLVKPEDILPVSKESQNIPKDPTKESSYDNEPDSEFVKRQKREFKKLGTQQAYVSNKAFELYEEIKSLKKGVKASDDLSYILDHDLDWKSVKTALLNIKAKPDTVVNSKSVAESTIREMLNNQYKTKYNEIKNMKEDIVSKTKRELRKALLVDENDFFIKALDNAKNKSMALMNNTDTIRNTEIVFGRENGRKINELIFQKEIDNEADSIAWQNKERQEIKDLGIKPRSKESAAVQKYGEKQWITENGEVKEYGDAELKAEFNDAKTREKIKNAAKVIREKYDFYIDEANTVLTQLGFDAIPKRADYMRHFQELNDIFSRNGIPFNAQSMQEHVLPTDINGLTEFWSPQKNYFANAQHRTGMKTSYDAITGIDGYIGGIANLIYHTEDIQRGRAFEELIRDTYGEDKGWDNLENLPDLLKQERAAKIQDNHLSNYAAWVHEWTNNIAGKKNKLDRSVEATLGRKAFTVLDEARKQVGANMIGFNLSSAGTNFVAPFQALAKTNKLAFVKGTADTIKNIFIKDNFMDNNRFLTSRMGSDMISQNTWQKIQNAGFVFMKGADWFTSNQIVRSKYYELRAKGVPEAQAHAEAGQFAARIMGDRTKGANAQLYNSKLIGLVTQFQLEVNNQLYSMFYDTYHESKESARSNAIKTAAGMTFTLGQLFAFTHLFGKTFEAIAGYNPTFDAISMLATAFGLGEDEEEKTLSERLKSAADQLVDALPYVNILTGGGRIPVASGIPNLVGVATGGKDEYGNELTLEDELKKLLYLIPPTGGNQIKKTTQGLGMFDEDLPVAGSYTDSGNLRYPVEDTIGNRVQAALFGQYANKNAGEYFDNERLPLKSKQIQEYADLDMPIADYWKYRDGLKEQSTTKEKFDYINSLDVSDKQKNIMINNALTREDKIDMSNYDDFGSYEEFDFATKNPEKYEFFEANGISYNDYSASEDSKEAYNWAYNNPEKYQVTKQIDTFENYISYKDDIVSIKEQFSSDNGYSTAQRKAAVQQYIQSLNLDIPQKIMLEKMAGGYSIKDYKGYMYDYIESLPMTAEEKQAIHDQLFD